MAHASVWTDVNKGTTRNRGIAASKLKACTQKFPKRSVTHPPSHEPVIAHYLKQASTHPPTRKDNSNPCVMYITTIRRRSCRAREGHYLKLSWNALSLTKI